MTCSENMKTSPVNGVTVPIKNSKKSLSAVKSSSVFAAEVFRA